jgi:FkbM family methyltransferase
MPHTSEARRYTLPDGDALFHVNQHETDYMYAEIFDRRCYEHPRLDVPPAACVFDVGANIGIFSLFALKAWHAGRVFAFEPIPDIYQVLAANFRHTDRVRALNYAIDAARGAQTFTYYPRYSMMSGKYAEPAKDRAQVREYVYNRSFSLPNQEEGAILRENVDLLLASRFEPIARVCEARPLSEAMRELEVDRIDLLKLDVEGCELDVLSSLDAADWHHVDRLIVEVEDVDGRLDRVVALIESHGFEVETRQDAEYQRTNLHIVFGLPR